MRIVWQNDRFEIEGEDTYNYRETLKQHGFWWDQGKKAWYLVAGARLSEIRGLLPCTISPEAFKHYEEQAADAQKAVDASRATDAEIDIPCPAGLAFLPYQKAGIAYALRIFGDIK
jgi:SWI/SNF-related matrix-associated actin-dependent regulator 1 of chromatin subfamily A